MKSLMALLAAIFVAALFGSATVSKAAEEKGKMTTGEVRTMEGFIIDTKCATGKEARKMEQEGKLDQFVMTHSKECLLKCETGGCEFYSDGRLWSLDRDSIKAIEAYLAKPDSTPHIKAEVVPAKGDKVMLRNIESIK